MGFADNGHGRARQQSKNDFNPPCGPREPAYEGAKFDFNGYCLNHPNVRMCRPKQTPKKSEEPPERPKITYVIVRKTCHMCGEHALRSRKKKSWAQHGRKAVKLALRKGPKGLMVGTDTHAKTSGGHEGRATRGNGVHGTKVLQNSPTQSPDPTPHTSPESAGKPVSDPAIKLVKRAPPPPFPGRERPTKPPPQKRPPKGTKVGTDIQAKKNSGHGVRTTRGNGGHGAKVASDSQAHPPDAAPPASRKSSKRPVGHLAVKLVDWASPPSLPGRGRRGGRRRLQGAIPAGLPLTFRYSPRNGSKIQSRQNVRRNDTAIDERSCDNSRGSRTERRRNPRQR